MINKRYVVLAAHFMVAIALSSSILTSGSIGDDQPSSTIYGDPSKIRVRALGTINQPGQPLLAHKMLDGLPVDDNTMLFDQLRGDACTAEAALALLADQLDATTQFLMV